MTDPSEQRGPAELPLFPLRGAAAIPEPVGCLARCAQLVQRAIEQLPAHFPEPHRLDSCAWIGARLAEALPLPLPTRQKLLEMSDARERLALLNGLLQGSA